ncbi:transposase [Enterococcus sp. 10A9_DIV0425]|uniref:Transposase n=1 Tax=Candidatus Enterococcus wittei TaxID=1987383 RepID=A0A2C9XR07_9ENTE|nr:transposase [Enterococcus sp. 10A9_DIV0425]
MSYTQLIKDTLNILDLNIHFEENCLMKEKYKGQICLIYRGGFAIHLKNVYIATVSFSRKIYFEINVAQLVLSDFCLLVG